VTFTLDFPDCWDGKHLDSPKHKEHVAYGPCTAQFPIPIPAVKFVIFYKDQRYQGRFHAGLRDGVVDAWRRV